MSSFSTRRSPARGTRRLAPSRSGTGLFRRIASRVSRCRSPVERSITVSAPSGPPTGASRPRSSIELATAALPMFAFTLREAPADDHRLELHVALVRGDDGATCGDLFAHELRRDVLAEGDEPHLVGDKPRSRPQSLRAFVLHRRPVRPPLGEPLEARHGRGPGRVVERCTSPFVSRTSWNGTPRSPTAMRVFGCVSITPSLAGANRIRFRGLFSGRSRDHPQRSVVLTDRQPAR